MERVQIKACLASVYDSIQVASDGIQESRGQQPLCNYRPRDDVCGSVLRSFLGALRMKNEWNTIQVKCISRGDQTDRHKDKNNCVWMHYDKTGALCFILRDAFGILWSLKFISNSRFNIGSYYDKLLGVETLCIRIKNHFDKLDGAHASFLDECHGSSKPSIKLSWKNPRSFFLDDRCKWTELKDTGDNDITYRCIVLPTIVVQDLWFSSHPHHH